MADDRGVDEQVQRLGRQRSECRKREQRDLAVVDRSQHAADFTMSTMTRRMAPGRLVARTSGAVLIAAVTLAGCSSERDSMPAACLDGPQPIGRALQRAPAAVTLAGTTKLSTCISRSRTDAELQTLGSTLLRVADDLGERAATDDVAAMRLGYLVGATRRGVNANPGLATQLGRRLEQAARLDDAPAGARAALRSGLRAGQDSG